MDCVAVLQIDDSVASALGAAGEAEVTGGRLSGMSCPVLSDELGTFALGVWGKPCGLGSETSNEHMQKVWKGNLLSYFSRFLRVKCTHRVWGGGGVWVFCYCSFAPGLKCIHTVILSSALSKPDSVGNTEIKKRYRPHLLQRAPSSGEKEDAVQVAVTPGCGAVVCGYGSVCWALIPSQDAQVKFFLVS